MSESIDRCLQDNSRNSIDVFAFPSLQFEALVAINKDTSLLPDLTLEEYSSESAEESEDPPAEPTPEKPKVPGENDPEISVKTKINSNSLEKNSKDSDSSSNGDFKYVNSSKATLMSKSRNSKEFANSARTLVAGGVGGLMTEPVGKGLDVIATKSSAVSGTSSFSQWIRRGSTAWSNNYDPTGTKLSIEKHLQSAENATKQLVSTYQVDKDIYHKLGQDSLFQSLRLDGKGTLNLDSLSDVEKRHLESVRRSAGVAADKFDPIMTAEQRASFFRNFLHSEKPSLSSLEAETKLVSSLNRKESALHNVLTTDERLLLGSRQHSLAKVVDLRAAQAAAPELKWFTANGAVDNAKRSLLYTAATGAALGADRVVRENMYGDKAKSWESSALTVPLSVIHGNGLPGKVGMIGGSLLAGHVLDSAIEAPSWIPESYKSFSVCDAVPLGLAFAVPSKSKLAKSLMAGAAVIGGNAIESLTTSEKTQAGVALDAGTLDRSERTITSFNATVDELKKAAEKYNRGDYEQFFDNILSASRRTGAKLTDGEKLGNFRQNTAISLAAGELLLKNGTRLQTGTADEPAKFILGGQQLDLGGEALVTLWRAKNRLDQVRGSTQLQMDRVVNGKEVSKEELTDLDLVQKMIDANISAINGKHDIEEAKRYLHYFLEKGTTSSGVVAHKEMTFRKTFIEGIDKELAAHMQPHLSDHKLKAKLLRDQALAKLALTEYRLDRSSDPAAANLELFGTNNGREDLLGGQPKKYDGAIEIIAEAERLAPKNPDLPELKAIATRLASRKELLCKYLGDDLNTPRRKPDETRSVGLNGFLEVWKNEDGSSENRLTTDKTVNFWIENKDKVKEISMSVSKEESEDDQLLMVNTRQEQMQIYGSTGYQGLYQNYMSHVNSKGEVTTSMKLPEGCADSLMKKYRKYITR